MRSAELRIWLKHQYLTLVCLCELMKQGLDTETQSGHMNRGMCATDYQLKMGQRSMNIIGIMSFNGIEDVYISEENVNSDAFEDL